MRGMRVRGLRVSVSWGESQGVEVVEASSRAIVMGTRVMVRTIVRVSERR